MKILATLCSLGLVVACGNSVGSAAAASSTGGSTGTTGTAVTTTSSSTGSSGTTGGPCITLGDRCNAAMTCCTGLACSPTYAFCIIPDSPTTGTIAGSGDTGTASSSGTTGGVTGATGATGGSTTGGQSELGSCNPSPGWGGNSIGIGAYCTAGGGQCNQYNLKCADDLQSGGGNICINVNACSKDTDCGTAACCTPQTFAFITYQICEPVGCDTDGGTCPAGD